MSTGTLNGKKIVVTGGSSGIGFAAAKLFVQEGAKVAITGRDVKALEQAKLELGEQLVTLRSDTADLADLTALAKTLEGWGGLDHVFVNAGIAKFSPMEAVTEASFDEMFDVNVRGAFFVIQKLAPLMREGGSFVLNTSIVDELGMLNTSVYAASKAALRSLARTLAAELVGRNIRVNAVSPGPIQTPIFSKMGIPTDALDAMGKQLQEANPMKRFGRPEEVAKAARFLAFDATFTTGAELTVDGGLSQL